MLATSSIILRIINVETNSFVCDRGIFLLSLYLSDDRNATLRRWTRYGGVG